jgi:dihydroflavonol-4-reductase
MILVTGGTGLVGAHLLLNLIENGEENVRAIYRSSKNCLKTKSLFKKQDKEDLYEKIEWIEADIISIPALEIAFQNVTHVYHCAAHISFNPKDENQLRKVNIEGTANIVNFCIDKKVKKLCHVSSIAALGDLLQNETIITETTEWNPEVLHSDYAISKYGAEMEVWRGHQEGLQVVIINPGVIFGQGFYSQGSGAFFTATKKGLPFYTIGSTGYVAVDDVVKIMTLLMQSSSDGERFIVISENCTYKEIISKIAAKIGARKPSLEAKSWLLQIVWRLDWFLSKITRSSRKISKHSAQSLLKNDLISNEKISRFLTYKFQPIDDCIESIANDFK